MHVGIAAVVSTPDDAAFVAEAEGLGATSVWVAEAWGQDALTPLASNASRLVVAATWSCPGPNQSPEGR